MAGIAIEVQFRQDLVDALHRELVGPDLPPRGAKVDPDQPYVEILQESPSQRYSAGVLFPQSQPITELDDAGESDVNATADVDDDKPQLLETDAEGGDVKPGGSIAEQLADAYDETVRMANEYYPSAIGLSFLCQSPADGLLISPSASIYESQKPAEVLGNFRTVELANSGGRLGLRIGWG